MSRSRKFVVSAALAAFSALAAPVAASAQAPTQPGGGWDPAAPAAAAPAAPAAPPAQAAPPQAAAAPAPSAPAPEAAPQPPQPAPQAAPPAPPQPYAGTPPPGYAQPWPPPPPPPAYPARRPQQRGSWYIGFGLGGGQGEVSDSAGTHPFRDFVGPSPSSLSLDFRFGATLTPRLLAGLEIHAVGTQSTSGVEDTMIQSNAYDLGLTFFPAERGFYVRAATGRTVLQLDQGSFGKGHWSGWNLMGSAGYMWWLGQSFNLGLDLTGRRDWYGSDGPDSTQVWSLAVNFDWY